MLYISSGIEPSGSPSPGHTMGAAGSGLRSPLVLAAMTLQPKALASLAVSRPMAPLAKQILDGQSEIQSGCGGAVNVLATDTKGQALHLICLTTCQQLEHQIYAGQPSKEEGRSLTETVHAGWLLPSLLKKLELPEALRIGQELNSI